MQNEYKDENSQALNSNESLINKTVSEEELTGRFMSIFLSINVVNYVIGTISL